MKDEFDQEFLTPFGPKFFQFSAMYPGLEKIYTITPRIKELNGLVFRMKRDENGQWALQSQNLPGWIHKMTMELNDAIERSDSIPS